MKGAVNIHKVFSPGKALSSIGQFCGRQDQLEKSARALLQDGISIVIYGFRGVGKSSLALQVKAIAENDQDAINRLPENLRMDFSFFTSLANCAYGIEDVNQVILEILSESGDLNKYLPEERREEVNKIRLAVGASKAKLTGEKSTQKTSGRVDSQLSSIFAATVKIAVSQSKKEEVLVIVDEFDKVSEKTHFAEFMKSVEHLPVRFVVVGISDDVSQLLDDHKSVQRQIRGGTIYVPAMSHQEQLQIFSHANDKLHGEYEFSEPAQEYIANCASGHPYLVHCLGYNSLLAAEKNHTRMVTQKIAETALSDLTNDAEFDLEKSYKDAVKGSDIREYLLKAFADQPDEELLTKVVYPTILKEAGIPRNSLNSYAGHLVKEEYGAPLRRLGYGRYRFQDNVFKAYCRVRPYLFWSSAALSLTGTKVAARKKYGQN